MKIRNEQLFALQQSEKLYKTQPPVGEFSALLANEIENSETQENTSAVVPYTAKPLALSNVLDTVTPATEKSEDLQKVADQLEALFSGVEKYSNQLSNGDTGDLKSAYSMLENMNSQVQAFQVSYPDIQQRSPEMANIVNDLDVLVTTEMFKFNRGDYL